MCVFIYCDNFNLFFIYAFREYGFQLKFLEESINSVKNITNMVD